MRKILVVAAAVVAGEEGRALDEEGVRATWRERESVKRALVEWLHEWGYLDHGSDLDEEAVVRAVYQGLASSRADLLLVNLEDLWLEPHPQNMPGTSSERPNWRRKARYTLEEISSQEAVGEVLAIITRLRRGNANERGLSPQRGHSN